jgi:hypothetical protein
LHEVEAGKKTPAECLSLCSEKYPDLIPTLELALALSDWTPDDAEIATTQQSVWQTIESQMITGENTVDCGHAWELPRVARPVVSLMARRQRQRWMPLAVCAAMVALVLMGAWALTAASAMALPGSPLYGIKRADEDFQLRIAWSSQMRSQALAAIAVRRLEEARAEAARGNDRQALALMNEADGATRQLIDLAITLQRNHQMDTSIQNALAETLHAEYDALHHAQSDGQTALAQALSVSVADQQHVLSNGDIQTAPSLTPDPKSPPGASHPPRTPHATPSASPSPAAHPTPSGHPTPGSGNGNGSGAGSNNGNGNGNGNGTNNGKSGRS